MGWINDIIREQTEAAARKFFSSQDFHQMVWDVIGRMPDNAVPKNRAVFTRVMVERLISKHRWCRDRAHETGAIMMRELEAACAPYGDSDYEWTAKAARDWADEWSEDR